MSSNPRDPRTAAPDGLTADELQAEQAGDLPSRDAMSILDVGGIGAGLPLPSDVGGVLGGGLQGDTVPAPEPPAEVGQLTDQLPLLNQVDHVLDGGTIDRAVDGRLDAIPDLPTISVNNEETIA